MFCFLAMLTLRCTGLTKACLLLGFAFNVQPMILKALSVLLPNNLSLKKNTWLKNMKNRKYNLATACHSCSRHHRLNEAEQSNRDSTFVPNS